MHVVFVDNLIFELVEGHREYLHQPQLGLISLMACVEQAGFDVSLYDPKVEISLKRLKVDKHLYKQVATNILALQPDVVGLASLGTNFVYTTKIAGYIKEARPDVVVVLGGPHGSLLDVDILRTFPQYDVVARGESENIIVPLIRSVPRRYCRDVPGITYREYDGKIVRNVDSTLPVMDELPFAAYHKALISELSLDRLRVDVGRGCPFRCTFCSTSNFFGKFRLKSASRIVSDLDRLNTTYGIKRFAFPHDLFTANKKRLVEFCNAVEDRGYKWGTYSRIDTTTPELLSKMAKAGLCSIFYGVEVGSQEMQKTIKKNLKLELVDPIVRATLNEGIECFVSFIIGFPQETEKDLKDTVDFMGALLVQDPNMFVQLHVVTPDPGTELMAKYGHLLSYDRAVSNFTFPFLEGDEPDIMEAHPTLFTNHYYYRSAEGVARRKQVFTKAAFNSLRWLAYPRFCKLVESYGGSLNNVIEALDEWAGNPLTITPGQAFEFSSQLLGEYVIEGPKKTESLC